MTPPEGFALTMELGCILQVPLEFRNDLVSSLFLSPELLRYVFIREGIQAPSDSDFVVPLSNSNFSVGPVFVPEDSQELKFWGGGCVAKGHHLSEVGCSKLDSYRIYLTSCHHILAMSSYSDKLNEK